MQNEIVFWITIIVVLLAALYLWLRRRERREMQTWNDDHENWPDEHTKGMD